VRIPTGRFRLLLERTAASRCSAVASLLVCGADWEIRHIPGGGRRTVTCACLTGTSFK